MSTLTPADIAALNARWITLELAEQAHLFRVDSEEGRQLVGRNGGGDYAGIAIPNYLPGHQRPRDYRLRRDHPDLEQGGNGVAREKGKYLAPPGRGNLIYHPPGVTAEHLTDKNLPIAISEGEFKALALWRLAHLGAEFPRWLTIGITGCWSWRGVVGKMTGPNGERQQVKGVIADLDRVHWKDRTVYLVPDTNVNRKESVAQAWRALRIELERRGATVLLVEIPQEPDLNGIDDFLGRHGADAGFALFDAAKPTSTVQDHHFTDLGNARRLVARHGAEIFFVPAWKAWVAWDGRRWRRDDILEVENRAKETICSLYSEAAALGDADARKGLVAFALKSEAAQRINAMLQLARSELAVPTECFDTDPDVLNFVNGTVHLPTGELRPHRREDRVTKLIHYPYNPAAKCPTFLAFLFEIMGGEQDVERAGRLVDYLQKVFGYGVTGRTSQKIIFVCHGSGDNGKTTLLSTLRELLNEYSTLLQIDSLMERRFESTNAQADLADLRGARFAITSETEEAQRLSAGRLKRITQGMGSIRAVRKYENPFTFPETHKLFMDCNHRPRIRDDGPAIWRRIHLIPFTVAIPKDRQDKDLQAKLLGEAEGILAWIVEGARRWYAEGLQKPPEVDAATEEWRKESDVLEAFFSECCVMDKQATVSKDKLYAAYHTWTERSGEHTESKRGFGKKLLDRGFDEARDGNSRFWLGLKVVSDTNDTTDSGFSHEQDS